MNTNYNCDPCHKEQIMKKTEDGIVEFDHEDSVQRKNWDEGETKAPALKNPISISTELYSDSFPDVNTDVQCHKIIY
jgi:hypothetical protein